MHSFFLGWLLLYLFVVFSFCKKNDGFKESDCVGGEKEKEEGVFFGSYVDYPCPNNSVWIVGLIVVSPHWIVVTHEVDELNELSSKGLNKT